VRLVKPSTVRQWAAENAPARPALDNWTVKIKAARWKQFEEIRKTFRSADQARVKSGRSVIVFNIAGNNFRLIAAVHYNRARIYALKFMTHAEYNKNTWKNEL